MNNQVIALIGGGAWLLVYVISRKQRNRIFALLRILILGIPLSFTNIFGTSYGVSTMSWFNIFLMFILLSYFLKYLFKNEAYFNKISLLSILILLISVVPVIIGKETFEGLKHYINNSVLFLLLITGNSVKYSLSETDKKNLINDYIYGVLITSVCTVIQVIFIRVLNIRIGRYELLGNYRHAFGFIFEDYSFLSLYLATGAVLLYFTSIKKRKVEKKDIFLVSLMLISSILTSARTGIVSFIAVFALYSILKILDLLRKGSLKGIILVIINIIVIIVSYTLVGQTRSFAKFSSSGRGNLNTLAFNIFLDKPIFGIGFGSGNYIGMLPHNLLFQSLAQGGLLFTVPLLLLFGWLLYKSYKQSKELFPVILCVMFGAMFIPNIFNSRFFPVLLMLLSLYL